MGKYGDYPVGTWFISKDKPTFTHIRIEDGYRYVKSDNKVPSFDYLNNSVHPTYVIHTYLPEGLS